MWLKRAAFSANIAVAGWPFPAFLSAREKTLIIDDQSLRRTNNLPL
jgi:hypothetical protein